MNFLTTSNRDFLPKDKRSLIETKEKISRFRPKIFFLSSFCLLAVISLILFPQIIQKFAHYAAPIYGVYKVDPIITEGYKVKEYTGSEVADVLKNSGIVDPNITSQKEIAEVIGSPQVNEQNVVNADGRVLMLRNFLRSEGSPMANSASKFVEVADANHINWKLMPAIAETESGGGKLIPIKSNGNLSFNPFGYGVYGGNFLSFASWNDAIQNFGAYLVRVYGVNGLNPVTMEASYCPPCSLDHHWYRSVLEFMNEI